ncbi:hypothetical protein [Amycolatopsis silviterrae]|uniref:Uncharacterized protein n=1 Tax=Amycolatopsis silviterrae TaxID=1656914 RepID=A0ABW5H2M0_9PSEU
MVLRVDVSKLGLTRRSSGTFYTKAMAIDAYEVLRQFVDALGDLNGVLLVVVLPRALACDRRRGLPAYRALYQRVVSEVADRERPNPYAGLVQVGATAA